jgi:hypothetical protein
MVMTTFSRNWRMDKGKGKWSVLISSTADSVDSIVVAVEHNRRQLEQRSRPESQRCICRQRHQILFGFGFAESMITHRLRLTLHGRHLLVPVACGIQQ